MRFSTFSLLSLTSHSIYPVGMEKVHYNSGLAGKLSWE
jgi:hypothetical protein